MNSLSRSQLLTSVVARAISPECETARSVALLFLGNARVSLRKTNRGRVGESETKRGRMGESEVRRDE